MEEKIINIIKSFDNAFEYVKLVGGEGTQESPYQIVVIDNSIQENEIVAASHGKVFNINNVSELTENIAKEFIYQGIYSFKLYMIPKA